MNSLEDSRHISNITEMRSRKKLLPDEIAIETKDQEINKINVGYSCDIIHDSNEFYHIYKNIGTTYSVSLDSRFSIIVRGLSLIHI